MVNCKASSNAIRSFRAISVEKEGVRGRGRGGPEVREKGSEGVLGLKGGGDPVQVVQVKAKSQNKLLDPEDVPSEGTPTQVVPGRELRFDSEIGSNGEFINGNGKWGNVCQDLHASSGGLRPHRRHWEKSKTLESVKFG